MIVKLNGRELTHPVLLRQWGNHRSGEVLDQMTAEEGEVLKPPAR